MRSSKELRALAQEAVQRATSRGAERVDVHCTQTRSANVAADAAGVAPHVSASEGITVRVVVGERLGVCAAPSLRQLDRAVDVALQNARGAASDPAHPFVVPAGDAGDPPGPAVHETRLERRIALTEELLRSALASPLVTYAAGTYRASRRDFAVANSSGLAVADAIEAERLELELRAERGGASRSAMDVWCAQTDILREVEPRAWAESLVARARDALEAQPLEASPPRVLLMPGPASQLVALATQAFSAAGVAAGQSAMTGRAPGDEVYSPLVTLVDEPRGPRGARWRRFDDEGAPTRTTALVRAGKLDALLHDAATAHRAGVATTGHGVRRGAAGNTAPRPLNPVLEPGAGSVDDLLAEAGRAVLVTEPLMGSFTSNAVTGDFSVVAPFAFLVEGGQVRHALPPTSLGGNVHDVLRRVQGVGRDLRVYKSVTLPSLLVEGISCAT